MPNIEKIMIKVMLGVKLKVRKGIIQIVFSGESIHEETYWRYQTYYLNFSLSYVIDN